jgi:hypothetical protein
MSITISSDVKVKLGDSINKRINSILGRMIIIGGTRLGVPCFYINKYTLTSNESILAGIARDYTDANEWLIGDNNIKLILPEEYICL